MSAATYDGETMPAGALCHSHLGKVVQISLGSQGFSVTDMIIGVSHQADLVSDTRLTEPEDSWDIGRTDVTVSLARAGDVVLTSGALVTLDPVKSKGEDGRSA